MLHNRIKTLAITMMALLAVACVEGGATAGTTAPAPVPLIFSASVANTTLSTLVVTVTASDITTPLVFNITLPSGSNVANGTIKLPPGSARTITVRGYNAAGVETHEGSKTIDVTPGQNAAVSIAMLPLTGQVPVTATLGPVLITMTPATTSLMEGYSTQLVATITAPNGDNVPGAADWATSNPAIATVDQSGKVTAVAPGTVQITADYDGVAGSTQITVISSVIYSDNFENGVLGAEWSDVQRLSTQSFFGLSTAPNGQTYLGAFSAQTIALSLTSLPQHSQVTLAFDFEALGPLEGNSGSAVFHVYVNGGNGDVKTCLRTNFSNDPASFQAYPDVANGSNSHAAFTGAIAVGALGYNSTNWSGGAGADATYRIVCPIPHTGSSIAFSLDGVSLNDATIERWGVDNVVVTVQP